MKKMLRVFGILMGLCIAAFAVLAIALMFLVDPEDYKAPLIKAAKQYTGRELQINGDLDISVFPWLGLGVQDASLSNASGFGTLPFARVSDAQIRVKLLPLLKKQVEMDEVVLNGLELNLMRDQSGGNNWQDLAGSHEAQPETSAPSEESAPPVALASLALGGLSINGARITWDDQQSGVQYRLDPVRLTTDAMALAKPFSASLDLGFLDVKGGMQGQIQMRGKFSVAEGLQNIHGEGVDILADLAGQNFPGGKLKLETKAQVNLDLAQQVFELREWSGRTLGLEFSGRLTGFKILEEQASYEGRIKLGEFSPKALMQRLDTEVPQTADSTVLAKADFQSELKFAGQQLNLNAMQLRLDDTVVTGTFSLRNFSSPAYNFDLKTDALKLDRYLPPETKGKGVSAKSAVAPAGVAVATGGALPLDTLRGLNLSGKLAIGELEAFGLRSQDVKLTIVSKGGKLRVHPSTARMYGGSYSGDVSLDVSGREPQLSMNETVSGIQAGTLLQDLNGTTRVRGLADARVSLSGHGQDAEAIRKTLGGKLSFDLREGAIEGVDVMHRVRQAYALLKRKPLPADSGGNRTEFTFLRGTARVSDGVLRNDDLVGESPDMLVSGAGKVDLGKERVDYLLKVTLLKDRRPVDGASLQAVEGIEIPVPITGTFANADFRPDLGAALQATVKKKVEEKREEVKEKVENKVKEQLQDKLKGRFKGLFN